MKIMRKSQTEMMGLVILVLLIVIGAMFYVKFGLMSNKPEPDTSLAVQRAIFVAGAVARVDVCKNITLQQAIAYCDIKGQACGKDACVYIKEEVPKIIAAALGGEYELGTAGIAGKKFLFNVTRKGVQIAAAGVCPRFSGVPGTYTFKSDITQKEYDVVYKLC